MAHLTTHVLNTASGEPAVGLRVVLRHADLPDIVAEAITNAGGRLDKPFLEGEAFRPGVYELSFHVGDYFRAQARLAGQAAGGRPFLDVVPVRFGLAAGRDYHVPLLIQPYGYSTYRGS